MPVKKVEKVKEGSGKVIDVGAGVGGSSRFVAWKYNCEVTGVEYVPQLAKVASVLNKLMLTGARSPLVKLIVGDFTTLDLKQHHMEFEFDFLISQLVMLHIPNKSKLFQQSQRSLKSGGRFYIDDYFLKEGTNLSVQEVEILEKDVSIPGGYVLSKQDWIALLEKEGLQVDSWEDKTSEWSQFVWNRYESFLMQDEILRTKHGQTFVDEMGYFYEQIVKLFHTFDNFERLKETHPRIMKKATEFGWDITRPQCLGGVCIFGHKI